MRMWNVDMILPHQNGEILIEGVKIRRGIFQGDAMSPLLFVLAMNPLSQMIEDLGNGYRLNSIREKKPVKICHLVYMDDIKLFSPNRKETKKTD